MRLIDLVASGKLVRFTKYVNGNLWYKTDCGFEFPVSILDTGNGVFLPTDKAIYFMRYIRKALNENPVQRDSDTSEV